MAAGEARGDVGVGERLLAHALRPQRLPSVARRRALQAQRPPVTGSDVHV